MLVVDQVVPGGPACELLGLATCCWGCCTTDADEAKPASGGRGATTFLQVRITANSANSPIL